MKHFYLLTLALLCASLAWGEPISQKQALRIAQKFFSSQGVTMTQTARAKAFRAPSAGQAATSPYYIFNAGDSRGFAIVSGDDRTVPVLGYVDNGDYDVTNAPDNFKAWLTSYDKAISYLQTNNVKIVKAPAKADTKTTIEPMLTTTWDQTEPYNNACPDFFTYGKSVTGCVATAMAQLLYYHYQHSPGKMVTATQEEIPAYQCATYWNNIGQISVDAVPKDSPIDWANMTLTYGSSSTEAQKTAVANLMFYCGASVNMNYANAANGGSGAQDTKVPGALIKYFGFDPSTVCVSPSQYSTADWIDAVYNELKAGRPVLYSGQSDEGSGHEFIVDGYEGDNYFHVNWGWSGSYNGKFLLNVLSPESGGTGAGNIGTGYNNDQTAVFNAAPDHGGSAVQQLLTKDFSISGTTIAYNPYYIGNAQASFSCGFGIKREDGTLETIGTMRTVTLSQNMVQTKPGCSVDVSKCELPAGTYTIVPVCKVNGTETYQAMWSPSKYIQATVDASGIVTLQEMPQYNLSAANLEAGQVRKMNIPMSVSVDITNKSDALYTGQVYLFASTDIASKGQAVTSTKVALDAGATGNIILSFSPSTAGTYHLWVCADQGGNTVLAELGDVTVSVSASTSATLQITALTVNNSDVTTQREEGNYIVTNVSGTELKGKYTLKANEDIVNKSIHVTLYKYNNEKNSYEVYERSNSWITFSNYPKGASSDIKFDFTNLPSGRYKLLIACGTMDKSIPEIKDAIWSDDTYCFELTTPTGIQTINKDSAKSFAIYNLQGMKVGEASPATVDAALKLLHKGVHIVNGKKVSN